ncbi:TPA: 50S ribosomal protein L13 [bacterium]|nr:50S ribosomal protein L13 [bacterium]
MKTFTSRKEDVKHNWYVVNAEDKILGRLASQVAHILRGKHKPIYSPHLDAGDYVVVINAEKVKLTGKKLEEKFYYRHSGYPGHLKSFQCKDLLTTHPERVITLAVKGMLPHNRLGRQMLTKLKVYRGNVHPHSAQQPKELGI